MIARYAVLLALVGCFADRSGTAVGNPTMDAQLARVAGATVDSATLPVKSVSFALCDGSVRFISENVTILIWQGIATRQGGEVTGEF